MTDYIPDVEPEKPHVPPSGGDKTAAPGEQSIKDLAKIWGNNLPDPMTFAEAAEQYGRVARFGWKIVDSICHGTCPPAQSMVPDLYKAIKDVEKLRDGFTVFVNKGVGAAEWPASDPRYQRAKSIGLKVFLEADRTVRKAGDEHEKITNLDPRVFWKKKEADWGFWKGALMVGLGIVTLSTFADLLRTVKGRD